MKFNLVFLNLCILLGLFVQYSHADTPANCTYEEIRGSWVFFVDEGGKDKTVDCSSVGSVAYKYHVMLEYPDVATDEFGTTGFWTLIYNQGFEVVIHGRKWFAFSNYTGTGDNATSFCDQTQPGWSHDLLGHDWACFYGTKVGKLAPKPVIRGKNRNLKNAMFKVDYQFIDEINSIQSSWKAGHNELFDQLTMQQIINMAGGNHAQHFSFPKPAPQSEEVTRLDSLLPAEWDWRHVDGINYVPDVRNQGNCGSCYAFASAAMNEARLRVLSNNTIRLSFSPQDIVDCSRYSQGCSGGFPYLIGGKYAEDYGLVEESCNPYAGTEQGKCMTKASCKRHYSTAYQYVGGYYGACNEQQMKLELVNNGPMAVSFEVYPDFMQYRGGIYHHTGLRSRYNPFELTNHAVLLVGYGADKTTGEKFWTVKNSWGTGWGEQGYFRIRRGVDECAIESIAVKSDPMF